MEGWLFQGSVRDCCKQSDNHATTIFSNMMPEVSRIMRTNLKFFMVKTINPGSVNWKRDDRAAVAV